MVLRLSVFRLRKYVNLVVLYIIKTQYKRVKTREVCGFLHPSSLTIFPVLRAQHLEAPLGCLAGGPSLTCKRNPLVDHPPKLPRHQKGAQQSSRGGFQTNIGGLCPEVSNVTTREQRKPIKLDKPSFDCLCQLL